MPPEPALEVRKVQRASAVTLELTVVRSRVLKLSEAVSSRTSAFGTAFVCYVTTLLGPIQRGGFTGFRQTTTLGTW